MTNDIIVHADNAPALPRARDAITFDGIEENVLMLLKSSRSKAAYKSTYNLWRDWCHNHDTKPEAVNVKTVGAFLQSCEVSERTRHEYLVRLRKWLEIAAIAAQGPYARHFAMLKLMRHVPEENAVESARTQRALSDDEIAAAVNVWNKPTAAHTRNRALIALMIEAGLRRFEVAPLRWSDLHTETADDGSVYHWLRVRKGKRGKARSVIIADLYSMDALAAWREWCTDSVNVFPRVGKGGEVWDGQPMGDNNVYKIVRRTSAVSGVRFAPHDLRRTHITMLLRQGKPTSFVRDNAGHASLTTTSKYAIESDLEERAKGLLR